MADIGNDLIRELQIISEDVKQAFGELSETELNWKPNPDSWSVGQCLDHIITSNRAYKSKFEQISEGIYKPTVWSRIPLVSGIFGKLIIKAVHPDSVKKNKTFPVFEPGSSGISPSIIDEFVKAQQELTSFLQFSEGIDTKRMKIASPVSSLINLKLRDVFALLLLHERRHVQQAKRVMESEEFPGS